MAEQNGGENRFKNCLAILKVFLFLVSTPQQNAKISANFLKEINLTTDIWNLSGKHLINQITISATPLKLKGQ